ncbi:circadian clock-controlled protein daywake-like [Coccinella septempunctata]|uniref:circadian clock-controlled protein daywake-like n=1 Tax=Coccinella septempunctata TaxID=41139 RepID=UPI001D073370|nr:circadian clock-controlled protein daywake-like [Coccinella septempunctata]
MTPNITFSNKISRLVQIAPSSQKNHALSKSGRYQRRSFDDFLIGLLSKSCYFSAGLGDPCKVNDNDCCKNKFGRLVPLIINHLGNPLVIPRLKAGYGKGVLQLDQTLENVKIEGLNKATVKDSKLDLVAGKLVLFLHANELKLVTKYNINGRCLVVPLWGRGDATITLKNVDLVLDISIGLDNGKINMHGLKIPIKAGSIHYKFNSLFGENRKKILTPQFEKVINDNGILVLNEVLPEYSVQLEKHFGVVLKPVLAEIPLQAILLLPVLS